LFGVFPVRFRLFATLLWSFTALPRLLALFAARRSLSFRPFAILALRPTAPRLHRLSFPRWLRSRNRLRNLRFHRRRGRDRLRLLQRRQA
jgi:hypothetical protein